MTIWGGGFSPNWENRTLFHADNLDIMREMNSGSVNLIATDPPFNKGRDFHATPNSLAAGAKFQDRWSWERDVHNEWLDDIKDDHPKVWTVIEASRQTYGDDMGAFLCFMGVRLVEMHRILRKDGSIYLHCDPTASHYLKLLLDAVFGRKCFRNEIVWCYKSGGASPSKYFSKKHDIVLWYSKSHAEWTFNPQKEKSYNRNFKPYRFKGVEEFKDEIGWYTKVGMKDYWNIDMVGRTSKERTGYPTQKPIALYDRIVLASSSEGDMVLDPFCGCATTLISAERHNRKWVGIDIWDGAQAVVLDRLDQEYVKAPGAGATGRLPFGELAYATSVSVPRTPDEQKNAPYLRPKYKWKEPNGPRMSRKEMKRHLVDQHGAKCQGCDREFDDTRYLQLDHNVPRSDGGINHITNRVLLCGPCNQLKSNIYTLSGLRRQNKKQGYMTA